VSVFRPSFPSPFRLTARPLVCVFVCMLFSYMVPPTVPRLWFRLRFACLFLFLRSSFVFLRLVLPFPHPLDPLYFPVSLSFILCSRFPFPVSRFYTLHQVTHTSQSPLATSRSGTFNSHFRLFFYSLRLALCESDFFFWLRPQTQSENNNWVGSAAAHPTGIHRAGIKNQNPEAQEMFHATYFQAVRSDQPYFP